MISQGKSKCIGSSPSNSAKGDTKDYSSRRDEPYLIFKSSEPWRMQFTVLGQPGPRSLISREQL